MDGGCDPAPTTILEATWTPSPRYPAPVTSRCAATPRQRATRVLQRRIAELAGERAELTMTIDGVTRLAGGDRFDVVAPHDHEHVLGTSRRRPSPTWPTPWRGQTGRAGLA